MDPAEPAPPLTVPGARVLLRRTRTAQMLVVAAVLLGAVAVGGVTSLALIPLAALATLLLGLASWFWAGRVVDGTLSVDDRGVSLGEGRTAMRFERADVTEAMAIPGLVARAQLTLRGGSVIDVAVDSLETADALLDRLALDPTRRALRFPARAPGRQVLGALGGVAIGSYIGFYLGLLLVAAGLRHGVALAVPLATIFGLMGWVSTRPIELRVGTDGLTLRGAFKTRFVPFAELSGLGENGGDPMLYYRDGHTEVVWNSAVSRRPDLLAALQHRVNGALAANAEHEGLMARAAAFERRGRPLAQWRDEVARLVDPTKGYRDAGLSRREAEALLDDARSPIEHRLAAAMALRSLDAVEAPTRIRVAAEGCASPEMRAALERAGEGTLDEATVARAVAAVEKGRGWT
jgi:hypothetical protein